VTTNANRINQVRSESTRFVLKLSPAIALDVTSPRSHALSNAVVQNSLDAAIRACSAGSSLKLSPIMVPNRAGAVIQQEHAKSTPSAAMSRDRDDACIAA